MQIFVKTFSGRTITLEVETSFTIENVKQLICQKEGISIDVQSLFVLGKPMHNEKTLADYSVVRKSTIFQTIPLEGGLICSLLPFKSMNNEISQPFSDEANDWRIVRRGVSWKGKCQTQVCPAYDYEIIINSGFGIFSLRKILTTLKCPICHQLAKDINNIGFFKCKWEYKGMDSNDKKHKKSGIANKNAYTSYKEGDDIEWQFLSITCTPL